MRKDGTRAGFGIYIHWPFCASKCPYCDFNSHVQAVESPDDWATAFVSELNRYHQETSYSTVNSVFFGGGTPSLMPPKIVDSVLHAISERWTLTDNAEITLEANPTSVEAGRFSGYQSAGVNRISVGIQSLNDLSLRKLGRLHTAKEGLNAIEIAQSVFRRVSFDLIYARQNQTLDAWRAELAQALSLGTDHLSLYQLTIESGTAFGKLHEAGKLPGLPDDNFGADLFDMTQEMCSSRGLPAYEISNHAKHGQESEHNLIYWRGGDYIGVGPGAHGRIRVDGRRVATDTFKNPGQWLKAALGGNGENSRVVLNKNEQAIEYILMSLRLTEGLCLERLSEFGPFPFLSSVFKELQGYDLIEKTRSGYTTTPRGRLILNTVIEKITSSFP